MARPRKWLDHIAQDASISTAARLAIQQRMGAVLQYLPLAAYEHEESTEYVHQLRVGTRRAQAALVIFSEALPRRRQRKYRQAMRNTRRVAAPARELDVMIARLTKMKPQLNQEYGDKKGLRRALKQLARRRKKAQPALLKAAAQLQRSAPRKRLRSFVQAIRWRGQGAEPAWQDVARLRLNKLAVRFDEVAQPVIEQSLGEDQIEALHQLRIQGKRLRYTMELSVGVIGEGLQELYNFVQESQEGLGTINDAAVARSLLLEWAQHEDRRSVRLALRHLAELERRQLRRLLSDVPQWWDQQRLTAFWQRWNDVVGGLHLEKMGA